ncbi:MAG: phosphoribosylglycinamide formyltransferase [Cyclobacteriaceae bacterium]|nr:phosphoribosylglycinamide formyltransferase [Cyclobacteriaceae bacterium]
MAAKTPKHINTLAPKIAIFASGSGTNAEEIFKFFKDHPGVSVAGMLSNNPEAYALERAKKYNVPTFVFTRPQFKDTAEVIDWLTQQSVTHIVLAGFLWLIPENLIKAYPGKIINIHPALLPKFGGKGMYGMKVHEAVKTAGETETGITIHEVNQNYDEGKILFKAICPVLPDDTPETIANNVHQLEYAWYPKVIEDWILRS